MTRRGEEGYAVAAAVPCTLSSQTLLSPRVAPTDWNMEAEAYAAFYPLLDAGDVDVLFCGHIHYVRGDARALRRVWRSAPRWAWRYAFLT